MTTRKSEVSTEEAIAKEAKKGYDLLFVGIEHTRGKSGDFDPDIGRIATAFDGPLAIVAGQGVHLKQPEQSALRILVAVNGTDVSHRAAEVAITIARAFEAPITVLYVTRGARRTRQRQRSLRSYRQEQAILKDIVELADQYDQEVKTAVHADVAVESAILQTVKRGKHDLVVMGVSRRAGDKLFFGDTVAAVLEKTPTSILLVST